MATLFINCYLCIRIRADITFHHYRKDIGGNNENSRLSISFLSQVLLNSLINAVKIRIKSIKITFKGII
jgi:hypothetical protein